MNPWLDMGDADVHSDVLSWNLSNKFVILARCQQTNYLNIAKLDEDAIVSNNIENFHHYQSF